MFENKKVIIFDMDGTLIDSVGIWNEVDRLLIHQIRQDSQNDNENYQQQRDMRLRQYSQAENPYLEYCGFLKEKYQATLSQKEIHQLRYKIAQDFLQNQIDYKKDADVFIKELKRRGLKLVIASTTSLNNMNIYRTKNKNIMNKACIDDYFTSVYTREDAKNMKPHPEIYLRVVRELGVKKEECLVLEDSLIGVEAASRAGIDCVAIYDQYSHPDRKQIEQLSTYQFDHYASLIQQLQLEIEGKNMDKSYLCFSSSKYDQKIKQTLPYYEEFYQQVIDFVSIYASSPLKWLDIGCGTGKMAEMALNNIEIEKFVCCDCSKEMLDIARKRFDDSRFDFTLCASQDLTFDQKFDVVTAIQVHHYLKENDRQIAIQKCYRSLKENGLFITFENFAPESLMSKKLYLERWKRYQLKQGKSEKEAQNHIERYNHDYFPITIEKHRQLLKECGFSSIEILWLSYMQVGIVAIK